VIAVFYLNLDLPWLAMTAGMSAGVIGLGVQWVAGKKA
jgi:hypothetical protein